MHTVYPLRYMHVHEAGNHIGGGKPENQPMVFSTETALRNAAGPTFQILSRPNLITLAFVRLSHHACIAKFVLHRSSELVVLTKS